MLKKLDTNEGGGNYLSERFVVTQTDAGGKVYNLPGRLTSIKYRIYPYRHIFDNS